MVAKKVSARGPVAKRDAARAGHNAKDEKSDHAKVRGPVIVPPPHEDWIPETIAWYESLSISGQSLWYEPSDWQYAQVVGNMLNQLLTAPNAALFKSVMDGMDALGVTELARRRMRIEIERTDTGEDEQEKAAARTAIEERYLKLATGA